MKKFFAIAVILFLLLAAGVFVFIATFDANRYKSVAEKKLEELIGNPVSLGHLSLVWHGGLALHVAQIGVHDASGDPAANPILEIDGLNARLELMPLLQRDIQIGAVEIERPHVHVTREGDGKVRVAGIHPPKSKNPSSVFDGAGKALPLFIDKLSVKSGEIVFQDNASYHLNGRTHNCPHFVVSTGIFQSF